MNRKNFLKEIRGKQKLKHLEAQFYRSNSGILVCQWQDKKARKPVIAVSTMYTKGMSEISGHHGKVTPKPDLIHYYNLNMNGCDRLDQLVSYYNNLKRKTVK